MLFYEYILVYIYLFFCCSNNSSRVIQKITQTDHFHPLQTNPQKGKQISLSPYFYVGYLKILTFNPPKSSKQTDAHKSYNKRLLTVKDNIIKQRDDEILSLKQKISSLSAQSLKPEYTNILIQNLNSENTMLRDELEDLKLELSSLKDAHQRELADLEYSLKIRYEDVIKSKLKEQRNEIEGKFSDLRKNKTHIENQMYK